MEEGRTIVGNEFQLATNELDILWRVTDGYAAGGGWIELEIVEAHAEDGNYSPREDLVGKRIWLSDDMSDGNRGWRYDAKPSYDDGEWFNAKVSDVEPKHEGDEYHGGDIIPEIDGAWFPDDHGIKFFSE
jgi:hypothetical protein